ncbi:MAG: AI-2E family transporter [Pseudomonadota bacterium]
MPTFDRQAIAKRPSDYALIGLFWIAVFGALIFAQTLFIPIAVAILIALVMSPIRRGLNKIGLPSGLAAALIMVGLGAATFLLGSAAWAAIQMQGTDFDTLIPDALRRLEELTGIIQPVIEASEQIDNIVVDQDTTQVAVQNTSIFSLIAQGTPTLIGMTVFGATLAFFLIASGDMFYEKLVQVMPTLRDKARAVAIARSIEKHLSCYLLTITCVNAGLGVAVGLTMWALDMPSPLLFGLLAFFMNYIPYLGALVGVALTFLVGLLTFDTVGAAFIPALAYLGLTSLEGQFITPTLVGRRLKLNAVVVFLSLAVWAWLWSIVGMFLSTPILITLKACADRIHGLSAIGKFIGERHKPSDKDGLILKRFIPYEEEIVSDEVTDSSAAPMAAE